ncbi:MAG TPA: carbohydrate-binding protein [Edaphobacter sp.]
MTRLYKLRTLALCVVVALSESVSCGAQNPIIQTNFTGWNKWKTKTTTVSGATGAHDLYFLFRGDATGQLFNFDYWKFNKKSVKHPKS